MKTEKILIVNDIAGAGKVAGNVIFPLLSAAALEPAILPTLLLSTHADAPGRVTTLSTNEIYQQFLKRWEELGIQFSAYATGYFAEIEQITTFTDYYLTKKKEDPTQKLFVDPIMGDHGALYPGFNQEVPSRLRELIQHAEIVLPNLTEACLLTGHPYREEMDLNEMTDLAHKVNDLGAKNTILSGIKSTDVNGEERIGFLYYDEEGNSDLILHEYFAEDFFGTGDIVFSLVLAFYLKGLSLHEAIVKTARLTEKALRDTITLKRDSIYGVFFEPMMYDFMKALRALE